MLGAGDKVKMAKWSFEKFQEVSKVSCESPNAKIHAPLSPMKKSNSCSYFDGQITDGKMTMWAAPAPFWLSHNLFNASWLDHYHVASSLGMRP